LLALLILEVARRATGDKVYNALAQITQKDSRYLFAPNSTFEASPLERGITYTVHINKYGYRGADFAIPKPSGVKRIFVVGDSFAFGTGEQDNETIPYFLQENLRGQNIPAEVINAGIGHASPITHYVNLRDIHLKYQPDTVLLLFDFTDLWDDWHWERSAVLDKNGEIKRFDLCYINGKRDWWRTCFMYSAACRFLNNKVVRPLNKIRALGLKEYIRVCVTGKRAKAAIINSGKPVPEEIQLEQDGLLLMRGREKEALIRKQWPRTEKYLLKIKELLAKHNVEFIIVMYPHGIYVGADQWSRGRETWGFKTDYISKDYLAFELMREFTAKNGIAFINTLDDFLKAPPQKYFFEYDGHLTVEGNRVLADGILKNPAFKNIRNENN